ncbi:M17 family metallopeptidase [Dietzia kunjamensis]|uniref:leucyl aminopeptidase family protein n=1 Tax=Dietzia kunjamensis TaxID=322509 RepID=UPI002DBE71E3|nr:M17 family metallopeptidase [Dietzia kunjamensis]MEB8324717.1 M17 family metallopeptidase [Dietzia kunjamensis]
MSAVPGRPLPSVRVVSGPVPDATLTVATRAPEPGRVPLGHADEARVSVHDGRTVVEVELDDSTPRPGWSGAVDHGLGHRRAGAALARQVRDSRAEGPVTVAVPGALPADGVGDLVIGYLLGARGQDVFSADPAPVVPDLVVEVAPGSGSGDDDEAIVTRAVAAAEEAARATAMARDLAGAPSDLKTPEWLVARMAEALGAAGMRTEVIEGEGLVSGGFGGVLAVGGGSAAGPRVLVARRPGPGPRVLLVGKGITFDTGGISVKPADGMHLMRTDMAGSAAVVAAAAAFCADGSPGYADVDLTVVVPSAENMLSGSAYRPGDVVTHVGGTTSEVTNTDAEGRMVLADALAHGIAECDPEVVVDVATLTGAMKVALGMRTGAVMANDDDLADRVAAAGAAAGERWWRLPLPDDLRPAVRSDIADRRQAPTGPGAITAALFLEGFVDGRPWAHLDIAGPARSSEEIDEVGPVATGFATRTLLVLLRDLADRPRP